MDAPDVRPDLLPGISPQTTECTSSRAKAIDINPTIFDMPCAKLSGDEAQNRNLIGAIIYIPSSLENRACISSSPLTPSPVPSSMGHHDSPTFSSTVKLVLHHGSHSCHPVSLGVSIGRIMKKHNSSGSGACGILYSDEITLPALELHSDTLQRSGVPTDFAPEQIEMLLNCSSGGRVVVQSVEKTGLAPVIMGGNFFPIRATGGNDTTITWMRRLLSLFTGSGTPSEPEKIPVVVIEIPEDRWILDSGAAASLTGDYTLLEGRHPATPVNFIVANGQAVPSDSCGRAYGLVNLPGVRYAHGCHQNIISARHLVDLGCEVNFNSQGCTIRKNGTLIGKGPPATDLEGLYYLDSLQDALLDSSCPYCPPSRSPIGN